MKVSFSLPLHCPVHSFLFICRIGKRGEVGRGRDAGDEVVVIGESWKRGLVSVSMSDPTIKMHMLTYLPRRRILPSRCVKAVWIFLAWLRECAAHQQTLRAKASWLNESI